MKYKVLTNNNIGEFATEDLSLDFFDYSELKKFSRISRIFRIARKMSHYDALLAWNPNSEITLASFLTKFLFFKKTKIIYYDINLQRYISPKGSIKRLIKILILKSVDIFLVMHKDTSGYENYYKLKKNKLIYVPFKANNIDYIDTIKVEDRGYVLSLGASHRDFSTFITAMKKLEYPTVILLPKADIASYHNTKLDESNLPDHIKVIRHDFNEITWNEYIGFSRIVALPITKGTLQPAGISVCFEAMALGKPVVVTEGAFANEILNEEMAAIVPSADPEKLAEAIKRLWEDDEVRKRLAENGRQFALSLGGRERVIKEMLEKVFTVLEAG